MENKLKNNRFKAAIFDLDGTLINTIDDLANACNYALEKSGYPTHEVIKYKKFVGDGKRKLIERIIPSNEKSDEVIDKVEGLFDEYYSDHMFDKTAPYEGIVTLLEELKENKIKLAVVSNKPHKFISEIVEKYFPGVFEISFGHREGYKTKPNPQSVLEVIEKFNINKEECVYIGDSNVDMQTARNANLVSIGVLWGFRDEDELKAEGANFVVESSDEIKKLILG